jgi:threonylcarbamoyladenosine tRNA methylthiotransferase MtaB
MRRGYDTGFFKDLIYRLLDAVPDMGIGIDVMVGFPGEEEGKFENTLKFVESIPVAYLHVFPYSERPGTKASTFPNKVKNNVKKKRGEILRALGKKKRAAFAERFIGKKLSVLIEEKKDRETKLQKGFSENYIPVLITDGTSSLANNIVDVTANHANGGRILGRKITNG